MALRMLPIARPCTESYANMSADVLGDDKKRFCDKCKKHVHDLSEGTEAEARALFRESQGARVCVRFARDAKGNVRFRAAATLAVAVSLTSCSAVTPAAPPPQTVNEVDHDMGDGLPDLMDRCPDTYDDGDDGCPDIPDAGTD